MAAEQLAGPQHKLSNSPTPCYVPIVGIRIIDVRFRFETVLNLTFKQFYVVWVLKAVFTNSVIVQGKGSADSEKRLNTEVRCLVVFNGKIHVQARGASIGAIQIITSFIADFSMALTPFINAAYRIGPNKSQSFNKGQSCKSLDAN